MLHREALWLYRLMLLGGEGRSIRAGGREPVEPLWVSATAARPAPLALRRRLPRPVPLIVVATGAALPRLACAPAALRAVLVELVLATLCQARGFIPRRTLGDPRFSVVLLAVHDRRAGRGVARARWVLACVQRAPTSRWVTFKVNGLQCDNIIRY